MKNTCLSQEETIKAIYDKYSDYELSPDMDDMSAAWFDRMKMFR